MTEIKIIKDKKDLLFVTPLEIKNLLWGTQSIPHTYFYIGFVPEDAFYVHMVCEETEPLRTHTGRNVPVYQDSAMEIFLHFDPKGSCSPVYLNFEVNANGGIMAEYGTERVYRSYFTDEEYDQFDCKAEILNDKWTADIRIPVTILERIYGSLDLKAGSRFTFNLYKISESAEIEHYASYSPIKTSTPTFHVPEFFASGVLTDSIDLAD